MHGAPAWHQAGFKGAGVKIGVIDGGFEDFQRLMGTELPSSSVQARCYTDIGVFTSSISDCKDGVHGTAVTEAVFDIAPAATYYISNANTLGDLKTAVEVDGVAGRLMSSTNRYLGLGKAQAMAHPRSPTARSGLWTPP